MSFTGKESSSRLEEATGKQVLIFETTLFKTSDGSTERYRLSFDKTSEDERNAVAIEILFSLLPPDEETRRA